MIRRPVPVAPEYARGDDWKRVEHDLLAVLPDSARVVKKMQTDADEAQFVKFLEPTERCIMSLGDADDFFIRFQAICHDPRSTQTMAKLVTDLRDTCLRNFQRPLEEGRDP